MDRKGRWIGRERAHSAQKAGALDRSPPWMFFAQPMNRALSRFPLGPFCSALFAPYRGKKPVHFRTSRIPLLLGWLTLSARLLAQPLPEPLAFDSPHKLATVRAGQTNVIVTFAVTNLSRQPVIIHDVVLSCGCSVASLPARPWTLLPAAHGLISITTDLRGKSGSLLKSAVVQTSSGVRVLTYQVDIQEPTTPAERTRNQTLAQADRQAVFRGECAKCHAEPAKGKTGKELFAAACAICHEAEHRASMVPDLKALKQPATRDFWLQRITHGKPDTLMPAFAAPAGGPLTSAQIASLAEFLVAR